MNHPRIWPLEILAAIALSLAFAGCSSSHATEVQLPNGVRCASETHGSLFWQATNFTCTNAQGKVIGSYKSS
jgi:hypothetical protein